MLNPRCELEIWTWGVFPVHVTIVDKVGGVYRVTHELTYGKELEQLSANKIRYEEDVSGSQLIFSGVTNR